MANVSDYTKLVSSEHRTAPQFMATIAADVQPYVDLQNLLASIPGLYDIDLAIGEQLDAVGAWVGFSRNIKEPLAGVYFSWGTDGVGWGQGVWKGPFDPVSGVVSLPDDIYRVVLLAIIALNKWDGTVPGAYDAWNTSMAAEGYRILIQDNQDMTMAMAFLGKVPDAATAALIVQGYLDARPAGVSVSVHFIPSVTGAPLFGWGINNSNVAGWGSGCWAKNLG